MEELIGWWAQVVLLILVCVVGCVVGGVGGHGAGADTVLGENPK